MSRTTNDVHRGGTDRGARWAVVLAGGQGLRMADWIEATRGERLPKQFCAFTGSRSMLEHTLDRAAKLAPPARTLTVITRGHRRHLDEAPHARPWGRIIEQPVDRGTAPGILLPVAHVLEEDPDAVVLVFPSDHFIRPDSAFRRQADLAAQVAEALPDRIVLLGAVPDAADTDYGWILFDSNRRGPAPGAGPLAPGTVLEFREKPTPEEAERLFRAGALWNTMVLAARARTLWDMARWLLPHVTARLKAYRRVLRATREGRVPQEFQERALQGIYDDMTRADFSRDILQHAAGASVVVPLQNVEWSDWGRPERVQASLARLAARRPLGRFTPSPPHLFGGDPRPVPELSKAHLTGDLS